MKQLQSTSLVLLHHHLKALRLPTITAECEKLARQAAADNADHLTYLLQLTELELLERERKAAERRLKAARFPTHKTLEGFDFAVRPSVNKVLLCELARCEYIERRENVLLVGNPGTGKTHLATALGMAACGRGYRVRFFRLTELATQLLEARDERSLLGLKARQAEARPADLRRARLSAGLQDRRRAALRRHLQRLRAHQPDRHDQPAVPVLDRGAGLGAPHWRDPRPAHTPLPDHRDKGESYRLRDAKAKLRKGAAESGSSEPPRRALEGGQTSS